MTVEGNTLLPCCIDPASFTTHVFSLTGIVRTISVIVEFTKYLHTFYFLCNRFIIGHHLSLRQVYSIWTHCLQQQPLYVIHKICKDCGIPKLYCSNNCCTLVRNIKFENIRRELYSHNIFNHEKLPLPCDSMMVQLWKKDLDMAQISQSNFIGVCCQVLNNPFVQCKKGWSYFFSNANPIFTVCRKVL